MSKKKKNLPQQCECIPMDVTIKSVGYPHHRGYENEILLEHVIPNKIVEFVGKKNLDRAFILAKLQAVRTYYIESDGSYEVLLTLPNPEMTEREIHLFKDFIGTSVHMAKMLNDYKDLNLEFAKRFGFITPSESNEPTSEQSPEGDCEHACTDEKERKCELPQKSYSVKLLNIGSKKLAVVKVVHSYLNLSLKESVDLTNSCGYVIEHTDEQTAISIKNALEEAGATAEIEAENNSNCEHTQREKQEQESCYVIELRRMSDYSHFTSVYKLFHDIAQEDDKMITSRMKSIVDGRYVRMYFDSENYAKRIKAAFEESGTIVSDVVRMRTQALHPNDCYACNELTDEDLSWVYNNGKETVDTIEETTEIANNALLEDIGNIVDAQAEALGLNASKCEKSSFPLFIRRENYNENIAFCNMLKKEGDERYGVILRKKIFPVSTAEEQDRFITVCSYLKSTFDSNKILISRLLAHNNNVICVSGDKEKMTTIASQLNLRGCDTIVIDFLTNNNEVNHK